MSYQVIIPKPVQKQLDSLPDKVQSRVIKQLLALKDDPRPQDYIKLKNYENEFRI